MEFDKFTPYMPKTSITFNVFGQPIDRHPVVIWYNGNEDMYYFVKARSANDDENQQKKPYPFEVLIPANATAKHQLFKKDSYVDCSQIFKMDREEFLQAYGTNEIPKVKQLPFNYATQILNQIENALKNNHISLMNVSIKGFNNQKQPIIEPELLYASEASFNQEKDWYDNLTSDAIKAEVAKFLNTYHQKTNQAVELNSIKDGIYIVNEELRYRINYPVYHYIYDNELLDKGYNVIQIIDLIKKDIFNTEEFKDYKVSDADVWGSLALRWGDSRVDLNIVDEYKINSQKLIDIQQNYFFYNVEDNQLLEFKSAYENEALAEWIGNSCFYDEFNEWLSWKTMDVNPSLEWQASHFVKQRFRIENLSAIDEELKYRNLLSKQEHQEDKEQKTLQKPIKKKSPEFRM